MLKRFIFHIVAAFCFPQFASTCSKHGSQQRSRSRRTLNKQAVRTRQVGRVCRARLPQTISRSCVLHHFRKNFWSTIFWSTVFSAARNRAGGALRAPPAPVFAARIAIWGGKNCRPKSCRPNYFPDVLDAVCSDFVVFDKSTGIVLQ